PLLEMRFEDVDRVSVQLVALFILADLVAEEALRAARKHTLVYELVELLVERFVAAEIAGVEKRCLHLEVLGGEIDAVLQAADGVADLEIGVDEGVEDLLVDGLDVWIEAAGEEEEQVDVRARVELAAAVPALGDDGQALVEAIVALEIVHGSG